MNQNKFENRIILGDCIDKIKELPNDYFDVIISDPPYNIGKNFGNNFDKLELNNYLDWCDTWITECFRVLKPEGTMFIYGFSEILARVSSRIENQQRWIIWHYTNKNVASLNFWQRSHESIIVTWKNKPKFIRDQVRESYTEAFLNNAAGKKRKDTIGRYSKSGKETTYNAHEGGALPRDVIKIPALAGGAGRAERWFICHDCDKALPPSELKKHLAHNTEKHPTQKPKELTRKLLLSCLEINTGNLLVPFSGTGSECMVARELGINFTAFELNPDYIMLAEAMMNSVDLQIDYKELD
jgi:site-specific DNA-methyltransferase (adenine-specific)